MKLLAKATVTLNDSNNFDKKTKMENLTCCYQIEFDGLSVSNTGQDELSTQIKNLIENNLKTYKNSKFPALSTKLPSIYQNKLDNKKDNKALTSEEVQALLKSSIDEYEKSISFNESQFIQTTLNQVTNVINDDKTLEGLDSDTEGVLTTHMTINNLKKLSQEINKKILTNGFSKLIPDNILIKKSTFEYSIAKQNGKSNIRQLDLTPYKDLTIRQSPQEAMGKSPAKNYLTNGSLEIRISLNNGEVKEKRILLPYQAIEDAHIQQFPNDFEKASIRFEYNVEKYEFLTKGFELDFELTNKEKVKCKVTPVYLYEESYYTGSEVFLDCYVSKPGSKTKASVKRTKFQKTDRLTKEKQNQVRRLRNEGVDTDDEEYEDEGDMS